MGSEMCIRDSDDDNDDDDVTGNVDGDDDDNDDVDGSGDEKDDDLPKDGWCGHVQHISMDQIHCEIHWAKPLRRVLRGFFQGSSL